MLLQKQTQPVTYEAFKITFATIATILLIQTPVTLSARTYHLDATHIAANDSGQGDIEQPFRTIAAASAAFMPGDELIIWSGIYRGRMKLPASEQWQRAPHSIIRAADGALVEIRGSEIVTGWQSLDNGVWFKKGWPHNSQQVFIDGEPLTQIGGEIFGDFPTNSKHSLAGIGGKSGIWPGRIDGDEHDLIERSFHYDRDNKVLYVRSDTSVDINDHTLEVSVIPYLLSGRNVNNLTVKNIKFSHSNTTSVSRGGAITLAGDHITLEALRIERADGVGLVLRGDNNTVLASIIRFSGQLGMNMSGRNNRLIDNETSFNNTRGFDKWWEAGGAKFISNGGLQSSDIQRHRSFHNSGDGLWFDWGNTGNTVSGCTVAYNSGFGIHYEASRDSVITNNVVFGNGQRGIYLMESSGVRVSNNLIVANKLEGVAIIDEGRIDRDNRLDLRPKDNKITRNTIAWNGGRANLIIPASGRNHSNKNVFITEQERIQFLTGWPKATGTIKADTLQLWRIRTGNDESSRHFIAKIPKLLENSIQNEELQPDWTEISKITGYDPLPENSCLTSEADHPIHRPGYHKASPQ